MQRRTSIAVGALVLAGLGIGLYFVSNRDKGRPSHWQLESTPRVVQDTQGRDERSNGWREQQILGFEAGTVTQQDRVENPDGQVVMDVSSRSTLGTLPTIWRPGETHRVTVDISQEVRTRDLPISFESRIESEALELAGFESQRGCSKPVAAVDAKVASDRLTCEFRLPEDFAGESFTVVLIVPGFGRVEHVYAGVRDASAAPQPATPTQPPEVPTPPPAVATEGNGSSSTPPRPPPGALERATPTQPPEIPTPPPAVATEGNGSASTPQRPPPGAGEPTTPPVAPPAVRAADLTLPELSRVGAQPTDPRPVVVTLTRKGEIRVRGEDRALSPVELEGYIKRHLESAGAAARETSGTSKVAILINADETLPWGAVNWVVEAAAKLRIYKIYFGARTRTGEEGALAILLGSDGSTVASGGRRRERFDKLPVRLFSSSSGESDVEAYYAAVAGLSFKKRAGLVVNIQQLDGRVAYGDVARVVDCTLRGGIRHIILQRSYPLLPRGEDNSAAGFQTRIESLRKERRSLKIRVDRQVIGPSGPGQGGPTPLGRDGGPWGANLEIDPIPPEEREEPIIRDDEIAGHAEKDKDLPFGESFGQSEGLSDNPFSGPAQSGAFSGRTKARGAQEHKAVHAAVDRALRWLAAHQSPNGGWAAKDFGTWCNGKLVELAGEFTEDRGKAIYDVGVTGLALQAFLAEGYTHQGRHPFARAISRGMRYLKTLQDPEGCFGPRSASTYNYCHAMATIAMVEAYGMTLNPLYKNSAQRGLDFIALARNPYFAWRYGIKPGDNDTSVSSWMMMALNSAQVINKDAIKRGKPAPLTIDKSAFDGLKAWLDKVTDPDYGRVGYVQRGTGPARPAELVKQFPGEMSESMTAIGVYARMRMGEHPRKSSVVRKGLALIARLPPVWDRASGRLDMYYWHWGALAMFEAGGTPFEKWHRSLVRVIVQHQRKDGGLCGFAGSWDPRGPWGPDGGRIYSTALMALCLQSGYRYTRVTSDK